DPFEQKSFVTPVNLTKIPDQSAFSISSETAICDVPQKYLQPFRIEEMRWDMSIDSNDGWLEDSKHPEDVADYEYESQKNVEQDRKSETKIAHVSRKNSSTTQLLRKINDFKKTTKESISSGVNDDLGSKIEARESFCEYLKSLLTKMIEKS
ncbi:hypothetical protein HK096_001416, partial [Nowakowskiella sp. JEL0078]